MSDTSSLPSIYPILRYDDAPGAIDFLTKAFQLERTAVHEGTGGAIDHALLSWGNGVVMLSSAGTGDDRFVPGKVVVYLAVDDPDAHHDHAAAAGAEVVMELVDQPYGSREYAALDSEGNVWCFGTYRPGPDATD